MKYLFLFNAFILVFLVNAQEEVIIEESSEHILWGPIEELPVYIGCEELEPQEKEQCTQFSLSEFIMSNLEYPTEAMRSEYEGKVWISFEVLKSGEIGDVNILKGIHESLDSAVVEVIKKLPPMIPGNQRGIPIDIKISIPVVFNIR